MSIVQAIILGLVQGLTEFIPVSSSGHLVIMHHLLGVSTTGLSFDVALHLGTLMALLVFFHRDLITLAVALFKKSKQTRLAWLLAAATVPAVIAGVLLESAAETSFRSLRLVSFALLIMALVMLVAEKLSAARHTRTTLERVSFSQAMWMGIAQAIALIPGVSRSGVTITAGLFSGMDRVAATRFSFLLAIPITLGAAAKVLGSNNALQQIKSEQLVFAVGALTAFLAGLMAIRFLLRFLSKHSLAVFAYYRIFLALIILATIAR